MSIARPARCLLSQASRIPSRTTVIPSHLRYFSSTPCHNARRRSRFRSIKAEDMAQLENKPTKLTQEQKELLSHRYTPEQIAIIEAAQTSVDPKDLAAQAEYRDDPMAITYPEDFSKIDAVVDKVPKKDLDPSLDYTISPKNDEEVAEELMNWTLRISQDPRFELPAGAREDGPEEAKAAQELEIELDKFLRDPRSSINVGHPKPYKGQGSAEESGYPWRTTNSDAEKVYQALEDAGHDVRAPELPKITSPVIQSVVETNLEASEAKTRLQHQTGLPQNIIDTVRTKRLVTHRVVNQTRMGKIQSQYILTIAGNENGMLGIGEGKSAEFDDAIRNSMQNAIRNMRPVVRYENRTIYGDVEAKVGATEVVLRARPPGYGVRTQSLIFEMCRMAGIKDLSASVPRSRNKMNTVKAAYQALMSQKLPQDIARARGKKLVDVRKVYYGGQVY